MAPWKFGANMKPTPTSSMQRATCSGVMLMLTPRASSTSALPDFDDTERPPCLATRAPAAAATKAAAVEMLKVCAASPPVPQVSTRWKVSRTGTLVANSRITVAAALISPMVSFFTRRPVMRAAISTGLISPVMIWRIRPSISSWKISRCSMIRFRASWGFRVALISGTPPENSSAIDGRARSGWIRGGTARLPPPATCGAPP